MFYLLPFQRFRYINLFNKKVALAYSQLVILLYCWAKKMKPILWLFKPAQYRLINCYKEKLSLYDCIDQWASTDSSKDKLLKNQEKLLLKKVDIVFTNSHPLYDLKRRLHSQVYCVPQGCNTALFLSKRKIKIPIDIKEIRHPRIGYVGNINHRLDLSLLTDLIARNPSWSFVFIGLINPDFSEDNIVDSKQQIQQLRKYHNVYFLGQKLKQQLPIYIDELDIAIIPYNIDEEMNLYCYPMKVFEYFCRGKPVISTPIETLLPLRPYVQIATDAHGFEQKINFFLSHGWPKEYVHTQQKLARQNSWQEKINAIGKYLI